MTNPSRTMVKKCLNCGNDFTIPVCRDWRENCCSSACKQIYKQTKVDELRKDRTRICAECGKEFVIKKSQIDSGQGKYCSHQCAIKAGAHSIARTQESKNKASITWKKNFAEGKFVLSKGRTPLTDDERKKAALDLARNYRKQNPHKIREWSLSRRSRKHGRLPKGTVSKLLCAQKHCCAICKKRVHGNNYHVDHIYPLSNGGKHEPSNVQILCPTCNVRKWAKDPILYMNELGFLL